MPSENRTAAEHYQRMLSPLVGAAGEQRTQKPLSEVLALVDFNATLSASRSVADVLSFLDELPAEPGATLEVIANGTKAD